MNSREWTLGGGQGGEAACPSRNVAEGRIKLQACVPRDRVSLVALCCAAFESEARSILMGHTTWRHARSTPI